MSAVLDSSSSVKPTSVLHPLTSLQPTEILRAREILVLHNGGKDIAWKIIALKEPNKAKVVTY
jgi:Cu2+-containing amine oxidase